MTDNRFIVHGDQGNFNIAVVAQCGDEIGLNPLAERQFRDAVDRGGIASGFHANFHGRGIGEFWDRFNDWLGTGLRRKASP